MDHIETTSEFELEPGMDLLLEAARPRLYERNAFRVLALPVDATTREIMKRQQMIEMARKTGLAVPVGPFNAFPLDPPPDDDEIRLAGQRLLEPERRLLEEFFWFWPHVSGQSRTDPGLAALVQGDVGQAEKLWNEQARQSSDGYVSKHNLAVLAHMRALDLETKNAETQDSHHLKKSWKQAYLQWKEVEQAEGFWSRLTARIRELNDPSLTTGLARRMRESLPAALLSINARLGVEAAEQGDIKEAEQHRDILALSGWETAKALHRAVLPVRNRIDILCRQAESDSNADPVHADRVAQGLLGHAKPLLAVLDTMLPEENPTRVGAHDEVALRVLSCEISFANKTERWNRALALLEEALPVAMSESSRRKLQENADIVRSNAEDGSDWCGEGYFDLPEKVVAILEKAREHAKFQQWDEAIQILKDILSGNNEITIEENTIPLIRKPLAYCLNIRGVRSLDKAFEENNKPLDFFARMTKKYENSLLGHDLLALSVLGGTYCDSCVNRLSGQYMQLTYNGLKYNLCLSCHAKLQQEQEARKHAFKKAIGKVAEDIVLAKALNPQNKNAVENLEEVEKIASKNGVTLPQGLRLLVQAGLATRAELIQALKDSNLSVRKNAHNKLKIIDFEYFRAIEKRKNKEKLVAAVGILVLSIVIYLSFFLQSKDTQVADVPGSAVKTPVAVQMPPIEMVPVKGGCFQMGDTFGDGDPDEKPVHEVCVSDFHIGKYEVTQGQWQAVMGGNPSEFKKGENYPVENVSWNDVQRFITKLNRKTGKKYRLPTEAEWEYAARRGGKKEKYSGGEYIDAVAWSSENSGGSTHHQVGTKSPNGLGIYDMSGNVWEWCADWYGESYYVNSPKNNPQGPDLGTIRVNRGGSWNLRPSYVRAAVRGWLAPDDRGCALGFRLVLPPGQ